MSRFIVLLMLCIGLATAPAMAQDLKIGYIDLQKALNESAAGKSAKLKLQSRADSFSSEVQARQDELKKLKEDLEKQAMLLSDEARSAKERDYQQKVKDYQRFTKDSQDELQRTDAELTRKILEDIIKVIETYGKQGGYTLILEKAESSLLYTDARIDVTDEVIKAFDKQGK